MKQVVLFVEKLLNDLKKLIHFPLSVGMATIGKSNMSDNYNSSDYDLQELQRRWICSTYTNVLRAKEAGGNCFFNNEVYIVFLY